MFTKIIMFIKNPKVIAFILGVLASFAATTATQVDDKIVSILEDMLVTQPVPTTVSPTEVIVTE